MFVGVHVIIVVVVFMLVGAMYDVVILYVRVWCVF